MKFCVSLLHISAGCRIGPRSHWSGSGHVKVAGSCQLQKRAILCKFKYNTDISRSWFRMLYLWLHNQNVFQGGPQVSTRLAPVPPPAPAPLYTTTRNRLAMLHHPLYADVRRAVPRHGHAVEDALLIRRSVLLYKPVAVSWAQPILYHRTKR
jgi:hypothetical protein